MAGPIAGGVRDHGLHISSRNMDHTDGDGKHRAWVEIFLTKTTVTNPLLLQAWREGAGTAADDTLG